MSQPQHTANTYYLPVYLCHAPHITLGENWYWFYGQKSCKLETANGGLKVTRLSMAASLNPGHSASPSPLLRVCLTDPHSQESGQGFLVHPRRAGCRGLADSRRGRFTVGKMEERGCHDTELCESLATSPLNYAKRNPGLSTALLIGMCYSKSL